MPNPTLASTRVEWSIFGGRGGWAMFGEDGEGMLDRCNEGRSFFEIQIVGWVRECWY